HSQISAPFCLIKSHATPPKVTAVSLMNPHISGAFWMSHAPISIAFSIIHPTNSPSRTGPSVTIHVNTSHAVFSTQLNSSPSKSTPSVRTQSQVSRPLSMSHPHMEPKISTPSVLIHSHAIDAQTGILFQISTAFVLTQFHTSPSIRTPSVFIQSQAFIAPSLIESQFEKIKDTAS